MATSPTSKQRDIKTNPDDNIIAEVSSPSDNVKAKHEENPLYGKSIDEIVAEVEPFCSKYGLEDKVDMIKRGAILAADPDNLNIVPDLTEKERTDVINETTHKWRQPWSTYFIVFVSSMAAVVQGMDEAVVNGAQIYYYDFLGLNHPGQQNSLLQGLVNSAPYLCCAVFSCWLTEPLNSYLGRRGTIMFCCIVTIIASIWQAFTYHWVQLFCARLLLGVGVGPNSATAPVFTAECAPAPIRGALVMQWQMWTAFGIALGDIVSVIFVDITPNVAWRLMLGSTLVGPLIVCGAIFLGPESPRWLIKKGRYRKAYDSMCRLRYSELQASRDVYYMIMLIESEQNMKRGRNLFKELFTVPRNRRATQASSLLMFMQQFCGVNVIAYYSSQVFVEAGRTRKQAILLTMGTGLVNWIFAIPGMLTIDTFGRRNLLLVSFPLMSIFLFITGFGFFIEDSNGRAAMVATGMYLFEVAYSPGEGPVPFTYSAEAFPLYIRDIGMSLATAVCWLFNFVLAFTLPLLLRAFKPQGAFGWYAGWCLIGWVLVFFTLPETKERTLEELDLVFSVPTGKHASYQLKNGLWHLRKWCGNKNQEPLPSLYSIGEKSVPQA